MQSVQLTVTPFFPKGIFQKAFFIFGLFAAGYFSYQHAKVLFAPQEPQLVRKKAKSKKSQTIAFAPVTTLNAPVTSHAEVHSFSYTQPVVDASAPLTPSAEATPAAADAAATAANPDASPAADAEQITDTNAPLIHAGVPYTGPAATDFTETQIIGPKPAHDPASLQQDIVPPVGLIPNQQPSSSGSSGSVSSSYSSNSGTPAVVSLTAQDLAILTSRPFAVVVDESSVQARGTSCTQAGACTPNMQIILSNNRWNKDHGIKNSGATLSIQNTVSAGAQFTLHFLVQSSASSDQSVDLNLVPTEVNSLENTQNNITYKTYELTFADATAVNEQIRQLKLVLIYQKAANQQAYVLSPGSEFSFVRSGFETVSQAWVSGSQNPINSSDAILKPDAQKHVLKIQ